MHVLFYCNGPQRLGAFGLVGTAARASFVARSSTAFYPIRFPKRAALGHSHLAPLWRRTGARHHGGHATLSPNPLDEERARVAGREQLGLVGKGKARHDSLSRARLAAHRVYTRARSVDLGADWVQLWILGYM